MDSNRKWEVINAFETARAITNHGILTKIGDLNISSGSLIIGDIIHGITENNGLVQKFPIGIFPVYYYRHINAGVFIIFDNSKRPDKWKMAVYFTTSKNPLKTFKVETGDFVFVDKEGIDIIINNEEKKVYPNGFTEDEISQRFKNNKEILHFDIPIVNSKNNILLMHTEWEMIHITLI